MLEHVLLVVPTSNLTEHTMLKLPILVYLDNDLFVSGNTTVPDPDTDFSLYLLLNHDMVDTWIYLYFHSPVLVGRGVDL